MITHHLKTRNHLIALAALLTSWGTFAACTDDDFYGYATRSAHFDDGLPATLHLQVSASDMSSYTRALGDDDFVSDLYVAIYDSTGQRMWQHYYDDVLTNDDVDADAHTIKISTTSAHNVKILAVANIANANNSYVNYLQTYGSTYNMLTSFIYFLSDSTDVHLYANTMLMSGWYTDDDADIADVSTIPSVDIEPGEDVTLPGSIKLKRLLSYNKFNIKPGPNINLHLNTWQVGLVPPSCFLFERLSNVNSYRSSFQDSKLSHSFDTDGTTRSFNFYILENKHTALTFRPLDADTTDWVGIRPYADPQKMYACREREFKDAATGCNTGAYKSLTSGSDPDVPNNNASYVTINADIDYYFIDTEYNRAHPDEAEPVAYSADQKLIHRTANVNYLIHLGYCTDKDANNQPTQATAADFNCRRNSSYTYNVTINGVNDIVVEAQTTTEPQPGAEGTVFDSYADEIELDAHYCTFNVKFTDAERANLKYRIVAPYGDETTTFERNTAADYNPAWEDDELFTWVKFAPTTDEQTLATYNGGVGLWSIESLCDPLTYPNTAAPDDQGNHWYTVFVDEYVYHKDDEGTIESSWEKYVNRDNRKVEFINNTDHSADGASDYSFCKYVFSQQSIQTFYQTAATGDGTAFGLEHTDETYCLNMVWHGTSSRSSLSTDNGRYNVWQYINEQGYKWANVIAETTPDSVKADVNTHAKAMTSHEAATYPVYQPATSTASAKLNTRPSPNDSRYFSARAICMNRNRDLDGDGVIQGSEIRWYVPTTNLYTQAAIGQDELPDPILRYRDLAPDLFTSNGSATSTAGKYYYHLITSDFQYYWAEEGVSFGERPIQQDETSCYSVRCIRNLGTDLTDDTTLRDKSAVTVSKAYTHDATAHTITLDKFTDISLRGYVSSGLVPHSIADEAGRPYRKFQYAADYMKGDTLAAQDQTLRDDYGYMGIQSAGQLEWFRSTGVWQQLYNNNKTIAQYEIVAAWTKSLQLNSLCKKYSEASDYSDRGSWRVPNFKELALMYMAGIRNGSYSIYTSTHDYFYNPDFVGSYDTYLYLYFGYNATSNRQVLARDLLGQGQQCITVRCVRDIK